MTKEKALAKINDHLNLLTDYDVIEATFADMLFKYLGEIIMDIDENPVDSRVKALAEMMELWSSMKTNDDDNFGTP
jgi:hypothetical protein